MALSLTATCSKPHRASAAATSCPSATLIFKSTQSSEQPGQLHSHGTPAQVVAPAIALFLTACASGPEGTGTGTPLQGNGSASTLADNIEQYILVDCLLPGQIRRLGTMMTYLDPRRTVKTTQSDCGIRGGESILFDRSDYSSAK